MSEIAILGLGIVGSRVAKHLMGQGVDTVVWNRTPKEEFLNDVANPAWAAVAAPVISLYLKDREACKEVFKQLKPGLTSDHIIMNHSTIDLATVKELAAQCAEIGCAYLDCPFTGSKSFAEEGNLVYYVSGDKTVYEKVKPLLEKSSKGILYLGDVMGQGTVLKLSTNLIQATMVQGLAEALALVKSQGMNAEDLLAGLEQNVGMSPLAKLKLPLMEQGKYEANFSLDNMRKDTVYAKELAESQGMIPPAISLVSQVMTDLCAQGLKDEDFCVLFKQFDK